MKRFFRTAFAALAMITVMLLCAGLTLRFALHAHEVPIPDFAGMTVSEASEAALHNGLDLNLENSFYSTTIPAGRILSQAPAAGSRVRRGWQVRVTESLGPQQVTIPDTVGQPVREATMALRRTQLDLGTMAHIDAPGDPDIVLAQTPPPNAGVDQPRVNLLLSTAGSEETSAFVMPSFVGMAYGPANRTAISLGLRVAAIFDAPAPTAPTSLGGTSGPPTLPGQPAAIASAPVVPAGLITAQSPEAGHRTARGATVRLIFGHTFPASSPYATPSPATNTASPSTGASPVAGGTTDATKPPTL